MPDICFAQIKRLICLNQVNQFLFAEPNTDFVRNPVDIQSSIESFQPVVMFLGYKSAGFPKKTGPLGYKGFIGSRFSDRYSVTSLSSILEFCHFHKFTFQDFSAVTAERPLGSSCKYHFFYRRWFDPTGNRTRVYRFSSRHSIDPTTDQLC